MSVDSVLLDLVADVIADDANQVGGPPIYERWIKVAAEGVYSRDRARTRFVDFVAAGGTNRLPIAGTTLALALAKRADANGFLISIEYPIDQKPKAVLQGDQWAFYPEDVSPDQVTHIELFQVTPPASSVVRARFGALHRAGLDVPTGVTATVNGTPGATAYVYGVTATDAYGETTPCADVIVTTGPASLSAVDSITLTWTAVLDAVAYKPYRISGGTSTGLIGTVAAGTVTLIDTGLAGNGVAPPKKNTTKSSISEEDMGAFVSLAASYIFPRLAAKKVGARVSGLAASGVAWQAMRAEFMAMADWHRANYNRHMHPPEDELEAGWAESQGVPKSRSGGLRHFGMYNEQSRQRMR